MDVWIILRVDVLQFRMKSCITLAGEAGIAFIDLGKRVAFVEVGVVIISW
jgi:hypothetical protein